ncbi:MAG: hypothetical protein ABFS35_23570 [Bacteroidota bacterium]
MARKNKTLKLIDEFKSLTKLYNQINIRLEKSKFHHLTTDRDWISDTDNEKTTYNEEYDISIFQDYKKGKLVTSLYINDNNYSMNSNKIEIRLDDFDDLENMLTFAKKHAMFLIKKYGTINE